MLTLLNELEELFAKNCTVKTSPEYTVILGILIGILTKLKDPEDRTGRDVDVPIIVPFRSNL